MKTLMSQLKEHISKKTKCVIELKEAQKVDLPLYAKESNNLQSLKGNLSRALSDFKKNQDLLNELRNSKEKTCGHDVEVSETEYTGTKNEDVPIFKANNKSFDLKNLGGDFVEPKKSVSTFQTKFSEKMVVKDSSTRNSSCISERENLRISSRNYKHTSVSPKEIDLKKEELEAALFQYCWCRLCNEFFDSTTLFLDHMHRHNHQNKMKRLDFELLRKAETKYASSLVNDTDLKSTILKSLVSETVHDNTLSENQRNLFKYGNNFLGNYFSL